MSRGADHDVVSRICSWCGKDLGRVDRSVCYAHPVTHGICEACFDILSNFKDISLQQLINGLEGPILAVEGNSGRVMAANESAAAAFGKSVGEITGQLGGEVTECVHAAEPGGCGMTVHCSGCSIRRLVSEVNACGADAIETRAFQYVVTPQGIRLRHYLLSAEKLKNLVLLRIIPQPGAEETGVDC